MRRAFFALLVLPAIAATPLAGQCAPALVAGGPVAGVRGVYPVSTGTVLASAMWDPDGSGPAQPLLVLGGSFSVAGNLVANSVVAVDPGTGACQALGPGFTGWVRSLAVTPNGDLLAGGWFSSGAAQLTPLMRWTGSVWVEVGPGQLSGYLNDVLVLPNGDVVVGGNCVLSAYPNSWCVARWNGQAWLPMGGGLQNVVNALAVLPTGELVAGGDDWTIGYCARWTGTTWAPLGSGPGGRIMDLARAPNGDLVAAGVFAQPMPFRVARWHGTTWSHVDTQPWTGEVLTVATMPNGDVLLGGQMSMTTGSAQVLRSGGGSWAPFQGEAARDGSSGFVDHLAVLPNGDVIAGGRFQSLHGVGGASVARWRANAWESVTPGTAGAVETMATLPNGDLVAAGSFHQIGGVVAHQVARFDGSTWSAMGADTNGWIQRVFVRGNGDVLVAGSFTTVDGQKANGIARWNGTRWVALGQTQSGPYQYSAAFAELPNADLIAATLFTSGSQTSGVGRWNGSTWSPVGWGLSGTIRVLRVLANGHVVAAGDLVLNGSPTVRVARWDGLQWTAVGNLQVPGLRDLLVLGNGDLLAAVTSYSTAVNDAVWRWNGASWVSLPGLTGSVAALRLLPGGDVLVSGDLQLAGQATGRMARWDGTTWSWHGPEYCSPEVVAEDGTLWLIPWRAVLGPTVVGAYARLLPTCPATVVPVGSGCTGSGGPVELGAMARPWLGATFRAVATGIPNGALVLGVRGLSGASIALATLLPQGLPGCTLLATVDQIDVLPAYAGTVFPAFPIPDAPPLVGQTLRYQVMPVQFGASGTLAAISSSNALVLTIGSM